DVDGDGSDGYDDDGAYDEKPKRKWLIPLIIVLALVLAGIITAIVLSLNSDPSGENKPTTSPSTSVSNSPTRSSASPTASSPTPSATSASPSPTPTETVEEITVNAGAYQGRNVNEVSQELSALGLAVSRNPVPSDQPEGTVLDVNPVGTLSRGDAVAITYSSGPEQVTVPGGLLNQPEASVSQQIVNAGLIPNVVRQPSADVPEGQVISVNPQQGASVNRGSTVTLVVSTGAPEPSASGNSNPDGP
ncbi:MAG: PASTA domain-containing protein, partial [Arthrobacter sp.]